MKISLRIGSLLASAIALLTLSMPAVAQGPAGKPNILFIMGDDIGIMQPSIYHRGLMVGETPNIDRIGNDGAIFMDLNANSILPLKLVRFVQFCLVSFAEADERINSLGFNACSGRKAFKTFHNVLYQSIQSHLIVVSFQNFWGEIK